MGRFYFHVLNDVRFETDEEGVALPGVAAARNHARRVLADLTAEEVANGQDVVHLCIMVDDEEGTRVADVKAVTKVVASDNPFAEA